MRIIIEGTADECLDVLRKIQQADKGKRDPVDGEWTITFEDDGSGWYTPTTLRGGYGEYRAKGTRA